MRAQRRVAAPDERRRQRRGQREQRNPGESEADISRDLVVKFGAEERTVCESAADDVGERDEREDDNQGKEKPAADRGQRL
jgi:hypothetical protein